MSKAIAASLIDAWCSRDDLATAVDTAEFGSWRALHPTASVDVDIDIGADYGGHVA